MPLSFLLLILTFLNKIPKAQFVVWLLLHHLRKDFRVQLTLCSIVTQQQKACQTSDVEMANGLLHQSPVTLEHFCYAISLVLS